MTGRGGWAVNSSQVGDIFQRAGLTELAEVAGEKAELEERLSEFEETQQEKSYLEERVLELEEVAEQKAALDERLAELEEVVSQKEELESRLAEMEEAAERRAEEESAGLEALEKDDSIPLWFKAIVALGLCTGGRVSECGATIKRLVQAARSTFYCPVCQR